MPEFREYQEHREYNGGYERHSYSLSPMTAFMERIADARKPYIDTIAWGSDGTPAGDKAIEGAKSALEAYDEQIAAYREQYPDQAAAYDAEQAQIAAEASQQQSIKEQRASDDAAWGQLAN